MPKAKQTIIRPLDGSPHQKYFVDIAGKQVEVPGGSTVAKIGGESGGMIHAAWLLGQQGRNYREEWDEASQIGDITHAFIQENLIHTEVDLSFCEKVPHLVETARTCAAKAFFFVEEHGLEVLAVERQLARPISLVDGTPYGYGGTIDLVVRDSSGNIVIVDWKTSKGLYPIPNYCQIIGYEQLWNHLHPEQMATKRVIVRIGKGDGDDYQEKWLEKPETLSKYWGIFEGQLFAWWKMKEAWRNK